jgi:hypothetical protein
MAGILDSKTRVLDTIMTQEGRRQLATGDFHIEFASFTDGEIFYEQDVSGSANAGQYVMFEASSLPSDQVAFEADDSGRLVAFKGSNLQFSDGKVLSGSSEGLSFVTGTQFVSTAESMLLTSELNFQRLRILRNDDAIFDEDKEFSLSVNDLTFHITTTIPFLENQVSKASVDKIESLFQDKRLSHLPNFRYLPPVNRPTIDGTATQLGDYPVIGQRQTPMEWDDISKSLQDREFREIEFLQTALKGNLVCQFFEIRQDSVQKLDVIDHGEFFVDGSLRRVFFVGKVFVDSYGTQTFVNMFTLVFGE